MLLGEGTRIVVTCHSQSTSPVLHSLLFARIAHTPASDKYSKLMNIILICHTKTNIATSLIKFWVHTHSVHTSVPKLTTGNPPPQKISLCEDGNGYQHIVSSSHVIFNIPHGYYKC